MIDERDGWFVTNVGDDPWYGTPSFGSVRVFEDVKAPFPQTGVRVYRLEPGQPNCRYHREEAQENFLVLGGEALLLVNGEERRLRAWDFVHCPPGVSHVFVGAGDGPCFLLAIGHRPATRALWYPESELARRHGCEAAEPTDDPAVAYRDATPWGPGERPDDWPPR